MINETLNLWIFVPLGYFYHHSYEFINKLNSINFIVIITYIGSVGIGCNIFSVNFWELFFDENSFLKLNFCDCYGFVDRSVAEFVCFQGGCSEV